MLKHTSLFVYIFVMFYMFPSSIQAQTFVLNQVQDSWELDKYIEILVDSTDTLTIEEVSSEHGQQAFQAYQQQQEKLEPHQTYWGKIQIVNQLPQADKYAEWYFYLSVSLTDIEIFQENKQGQFDHSLSGTFRPLAEKTFVTTNKGNIVKVLLPAHEVQTFYFKVRSDRSSVQPEFTLKIQHAFAFINSQHKEKRGVSFFLGFLMMMLFYNIMYYLFSRDKAYIYYSIYLIGLVSYTAYIAGDLAVLLEPYLFPQHPEYIQLSKLMVYFGLMGYWAFLRSFFHLHSLLPFWDKVFKYLILIGFPLMIIDVILMFSSNFSPNVSDVASMGYVALFAVSNLFFLKPLYDTKQKKAYFILAGVAAVAVGYLLTVLGRFESLNFRLVFFRVGAVFEIIAFSLGLAYRQREAEREQQQAKFALEKNKILQEKKQEEALRLKEIDELKTRLYTNITHEFRTPLTVIMGMADEIKGNENIKQLISRNSQSLLSLVNQILDLTKLQEGKMQLNYVHKDVVTYLQYLTEAFHSFASAQHIRLSAYTEIEELYMDFDEEKLAHIISNLLSNAVKFTPAHGKIILHINQKSTPNQQNYLQIKVKDTGVGIASDKLEQVFHRFYQIENSAHQAQQGTGIGLALVKELVELMGGSIGIKSELGKGTVFTILLPIQKTVEKSTEKKIKVMDIEKILSNTEVSTNEVIMSPSPSKKPILLLAEDNPDVAKYIEICLKDDYQMFIVDNGQKGINKALEIVPDIIISDVMMPQKSGFELCETLKNDERTSHIPIILLTAKVAQEDKLTGLKSRADAYLIKPFHKEELQIRLQNMLNLRTLLQEKYSQLIEVKSTHRQKRKKNASAETIVVKDLESEFLEKISAVILEHIDDPDLNVKQLCEAVFLSQTQVYRKMKALTSKTPSAFIRHIRLQKSLDLLKSTDMSITQIAFEVGFRDANYFSRVFSKNFGKTPSSTRE